MRVGIDASNLRAGGGITHLVELLKAADPLRDRFEAINVWGPRATLDRLSSRRWLNLEEPALLRSGPLARLRWLRGELSRKAARDCDILLVPGGTYVARFHPVVSMSRNMLPFDAVPLRRYGWSKVRARLVMLRFLQRRTFQTSDGVIFLTNTARSVVSRSTGHMRGVSIVIPHGIAKEFFAEPRQQRSLSSASEDDPIRLRYVSIVDVYKHQAEVAEAAAIVRREGLPITLDLLGPAYAPELRRLERVLDRVDPRRTFIRYSGDKAYSDLPALYRSADVFVFGSSCENLPNILLEAMASGLPIACSNRSVMPEVLGEAGVYFDPTDAGSIAAALRTMVGDADRRQHLAAAAYARARAYSWERCAAATFAFLHSVLDRYRSGLPS